MPKVEFIYDAGCPNVEPARQQLRRALAEVGFRARWDEWDRANPASPAYSKHFGSPTILVDGKDIAGCEPSENADSCRLYPAEGERTQGVPPVETIASALRRSAADVGNASGGSGAWMAVVPAVGMAMLPKLACPACWPAYAGILSSFGLGFLIDTAYLLPLTIAFLLVAVGVLALGARKRRGYVPFAVGLVASVAVVAGKFQFESDLAMYGGIALLIGASAWNAWPHRNKHAACPACVEAGNL